MSDRGKQLDVTPEGCVVADLEDFRRFADHSPPRPFVYLDQLKTDARHWKPVAMWIVGLGLVALGATIGWWSLILVGLVALAIWLRLFLNVVRYLRDSPVLIGIVEELRPHPVSQNYSTAQARLADARIIAITFVTRLVADALAEHGRAEVMILYDPKSEYSYGFAARALKSEAAR
jgi:hypothetical protein